MAEDGRDKRRAARQDVLGHALIITSEGRISCVIRDLSKTGAKLGVPQRYKLPPEFEVYLVKTRSKRRVALRWRTGDHAGVEFFSSAPIAPGIEESRPEQDVWIV